MTRLRVGCVCGLLVLWLGACATSPEPGRTVEARGAGGGSRVTALEGALTVGVAPQQEGFWAWLHRGEGFEEPERCVWTLTTARGVEVTTLDFVAEPEARDEVSGPCAISMSAFPGAEAAWPIQGSFSLALVVEQGGRRGEGAARYTLGDDLGAWGALDEVLKQEGTLGSLGLDAGPVHALSASGHLVTLEDPAGGEPIYGEIFLGAPAEGGWARCEAADGEGGVRSMCCAPEAMRAGEAKPGAERADRCAVQGDAVSCCASAGPWRVSLGGAAAQEASLRALTGRLLERLQPGPR